MFDKNKNGKHMKQRKKALEFATMQGVTFSDFTRYNIEQNQLATESHMNNVHSNTDSEVDEEDGYDGNN